MPVGIFQCTHRCGRQEQSWTTNTHSRKAQCSRAGHRHGGRRVFKEQRKQRGPVGIRVGGQVESSGVSQGQACVSKAPEGSTPLSPHRTQQFPSQWASPDHRAAITVCPLQSEALASAGRAITPSPPSPNTPAHGQIITGRALGNSTAVLSSLSPQPHTLQGSCLGGEGEL